VYGDTLLCLPGDKNILSIGLTGLSLLVFTHTATNPPVSFKLDVKSQFSTQVQSICTVSQKHQYLCPSLC